MSITRGSTADAPVDDLPTVATAWRDAIAVCWAAAPGLVLARVFSSMVLFLAEGVGLGLVLRKLVESAGSGGAVMWWALAVLAIVASRTVVSDLGDYARHVMFLQAQQRIRQQVMKAVTGPVGVGHLEDPRYADRIHQLLRSPERVSILFDWLSAQVATLVMLVAGIALLVQLHWALVAPVLLAMAAGTATARSRSKALELMDAATTEQRFGDRLVKIGTAPEAAFEIKMLDLGRWLLSTHRTARSAVERQILRGEKRVAVSSVAGALLQALSLSGAMAAVVALAFDGRIGAGDVAMGFVVLQSVITRAGYVGASWADLARNTFVARRYSWLIRLPHDATDTQHRRAGGPAATVPTALDDGIRFEGASFRYPGQDTLALDDVSLHLPAGTTVALVGDNGAGKSTIVKLLCRYYEPTAGRITVDGADLSALNPDEWRTALSGVQQDFDRYHFLLQHAIGIGLVEQVDDERAVAAATDAAGATAIADSLPQTYSSQLGLEYGGFALSEGQWQKVAVARSLMRAHPLLVVLDEPTAALDPEAEHELFERYRNAAATSRARGGITVIVSHRLSTVRNADLIVVIEDGRVAQVGSHTDLIASGGSYAEMFRMQSSRYR